MTAKYEALRQQVGDLAEQFADFMEKNDPRSATYRVASQRLIEQTHDRLMDLYNAEEDK
jgi:hypothetical protein